MVHGLCVACVMVHESVMVMTRLRRVMCMWGEDGMCGVPRFASTTILVLLSCISIAPSTFSNLAPPPVLEETMKV